MNKQFIKDLFDKPNAGKMPMHIINKIKLTLVTNAYNQMRLGLITSLLCATVILIGAYKTNDNNVLLLSWYSIFLVITGIRLIIKYAYNKQVLTATKIPQWRNLFLLGALLGGLSWGLVGAVLFPMANQNLQTLMILVMAGISAGAVPLLSAVLSAAIGFLLLTLVPLMVSLIFTNNNVFLLFDIAVLAYTAYLIALAVETHHMISSTISLKFENDQLLKNLLITKSNLEHSASHDPLTNVANRNLFARSLENAIQHSQQNKSILALLYIDLDNFKEVNDYYGHHIGDQVLLKIVERFRNILHSNDLISRLGGDEFTVILENITHPEKAADTAKLLCQSIANPIKINEFEIKLSASIGISIYPLDATDTESLLKIADNAMYYVKKHGHNNYHYTSNFLLFTSNSI